MSRKTHKFTAAAATAALIASFSSAELSGALAQALEQGDETDVVGQADGQPVDPIFVSDEIVQPLPSEEEQGAAGDDAQASSFASLGELVSNTETRSDLSDQMRCLAGAVYFESRGEPLAGQLAVAQVVINRTESSRFPTSYCGVVYQRAQFSFVKNGRMPRIRTGSEAWDRAKAIARIAHEGLWDSEAGDSLYFHAKYVRPSWSRKKTARATISQHIFYR